MSGGVERGLVNSEPGRRPRHRWIGRLSGLSEDPTKGRSLLDEEGSGGGGMKINCKAVAWQLNVCRVLYISEAKHFMNLVQLHAIVQLITQ